uniref:Uncharacterized protein n=1 Tax=Rangifer tarandus platyrhynchus TaxID=3082113 RepID=A0ACB0ETH7_RANTA|nr:unnamed protein product [Rangifer tarandus platyrhynchus]
MCWTRRSTRAPSILALKCVRLSTQSPAGCSACTARPLGGGGGSEDATAVPDVPGWCPWPHVRARRALYEGLPIRNSGQNHCVPRGRSMGDRSASPRVHPDYDLRILMWQLLPVWELEEPLRSRTGPLGALSPKAALRGPQGTAPPDPGQPPRSTLRPRAASTALDGPGPHTAFPAPGLGLRLLQATAATGTARSPDALLSRGRRFPATWNRRAAGQGDRAPGFKKCSMLSDRVLYESVKTI